MSLRPNSNLSPLRSGGNSAIHLQGGVRDMDTQVKLRQLEMNLLDIKGGIDRKMIQFSEEVP